MSMVEMSFLEEVMHLPLNRLRIHGVVGQAPQGGETTQSDYGA